MRTSARNAALTAATLVSLAFTSIASAEDVIIGPGLQRAQWAGPAVWAEPGSNLQAGSASFQVQMADNEVIELIGTYQEHLKAGDWLKSFEVLDQIQNHPKSGLLPAAEGYLLPVEVFAWQSIVDLPPEGRHRFEVFHGAKARALYEKALENPADEAAALEEVFNKYFVTKAGALAADRLGELMFERGRFDRALMCFEAVIRHHPDTDLSLLDLQVKAATAAARGGRWSAYERASRALTTRFAGETVKLGGEQVAVDDVLAPLDAMKEKAAQVASTPKAKPAPAMPASNTSDWEYQYLKTNEWSKVQQDLAQYRIFSGPPLPVFAMRGDHIVANWISSTFAIDVKTGERTWEEGSMSNAVSRARNHGSYGNMAIQSMQFAGDKLLVTAPSQNNYQCVAIRLIEPGSGKLLWNTTSQSDLSQITFGPKPLVVGKTIYATGNQYRAQNVALYAIDIETGKTQWKVELGTPVLDTNRRGGYQQSVLPRLAYDDGTLFVMTNCGALLAINTKTQQTEWGYTYDAEAPVLFDMSTGRWDYVSVTRPGMFRSDDVLVFKDSGATNLRALSTSTRRINWVQEVDKSATLVGVDDRFAYLQNDKLTAYDLNTGKEVWWSQHTKGAEKIHFTDDHIWALGDLGLIVLDRATGRAVALWESKDFEGGGSVLVTPEQVLCLLQQKIYAYRRDQPTE